MKTYTIEDNKYLVINKDGKSAVIDLDMLFPDAFITDFDKPIKYKQTCNNTHRECGYINFTNIIIDLLESHKIEGVSELASFLELRDFELKSGLLETGSSILAFLQSPYIKSILDLYVDVRKLRGIGDENLD